MSCTLRHVLGAGGAGFRSQLRVLDEVCGMLGKDDPAFIEAMPYATNSARISTGLLRPSASRPGAVRTVE